MTPAVPEMPTTKYVLFFPARHLPSRQFHKVCFGPIRTRVGRPDARKKLPMYSLGARKSRIPLAREADNPRHDSMIDPDHHGTAASNMKFAQGLPDVIGTPAVADTSIISPTALSAAMS